MDTKKEPVAEICLLSGFSRFRVLRR